MQYWTGRRRGLRTNAELDTASSKTLKKWGDTDLTIEAITLESLLAF